MQITASERIEQLEAALAEAEAGRAAAEARAHALIEQAMFSVQIFSPDGRTTFVNPAWERLTGATLAILHQIDYNVLTDPQLEAKGIMPYIRRGFAGEACTIPVIHYDAAENGLDGHAFDLRAFIYPVLDAAGQVREVVLMHEDVTAQVRAEQALQEALKAQATLTDRIIHHAPVAMAYFDADLVYRWNNPRHDEIMGLDPGAIAGRRLEDTVPAETFARMAPVYREVLTTGEAATRLAVPAAVGGTYWDCSYVPVPGEGGEVQGVLVLAVDASHRLAHEYLRESQLEALREADRAKDEFLSVISHELRTPLNFIMGFASAVADEVTGSLNDRQHEAMDKILTGADRMLHLVDDLLDFAKLQSGTFVLAPAPTAYGPLVEEVAALMQPLATRHGLTLTVEVDVPGPLVFDGGRVAQVLTNLVSNAFKFTPSGGSVKIRGFVRDGVVVTEVVDTGMGIAAADLDKLFQRFRQLDMGRTRRAGGTGLGLAIAKALVEAHGGAIGVTSVPERGSTFWFSLPNTGA